MDNYEATDNDRYLFKIIMDSFDETDAAYETTLFATQRLIDSQIKARDGTTDKYSTPRSAMGMTTETATDTASSSPSPSSSVSSAKRLSRPKAKAKVPDFVDFSTLTGKTKIAAMMKRNYCSQCMKKLHGEHAKCEAKGHQCKKCGKENHLEKCCAYPKSPENKN